MGLGIGVSLQSRPPRPTPKGLVAGCGVSAEKLGKPRSRLRAPASHLGRVDWHIRGRVVRNDLREGPGLEW